MRPYWTMNSYAGIRNHITIYDFIPAYEIISHIIYLYVNIAALNVQYGFLCRHIIKFNIIACINL